MVKVGYAYESGSRYQARPRSNNFQGNRSMSTKPKHPGLPPRHPLSALFPEHGGEPLEKLAADIKENGLRNPIMTYEGMVLDGWRRGLACEKAGVTPTFLQFKGTPEEAARFVWSENFHRRHLQIGELAICAGRYQIWLSEQANKNGEKIGDVPDKFGVSKSSVDNAKKVLKAEPELLEAVEKGVVTVTDAAKVADESPKVQRSAVKDVMERLEKTATASAAKQKSRNGTPVYDDKQITEPYGKLMRAVVARWQAMGAKEDAGFRSVKEALGVVHKKMEEWGVK